ncbi:phosphatidylinositol N-acetylglucosaminyltransferase-domain-containing protein [Neohortaea acidophila]|uniref:Phosphatidylinositol N-acetylglucosaminyltransferase-domain-containing protein n=1 Tax=Neohortaea acidophila TaxID=245834 RepID=A0A6A6Q1A6_9PEZI|nr:phosphatidylinositol N-acetylglucosaminyltransferase-domain-containing protein [Neohortaea acidophila]KAF2486035.1 phosphatidylinositol N-acetylglucosaminyltransferase-domain-containing protein [Neohortaea acidophila]
MSHFESTTTTEASRTSSLQSGRQSYLRPEDAFYAPPPLRKRSIAPNTAAPVAQTNGSFPDARKWREKRRGSSDSRRRRNGKEGSGPKVPWKKLLWVKQSYPDNYTDEETFLDHLQRNPRLRPYEFWPLVADSTIIVQHVCSVVIFVCCFTAIFQERVSPQTVVGWATLGTVAGWVLRDYWQTREESEVAAKLAAKEAGDSPVSAATDGDKTSARSSSDMADFGMPFKEQHIPLASIPPSALQSPPHSRIPSVNSMDTPLSANSETNLPSFPAIPTTSPNPDLPPCNGEPSALSARTRERLITAKSAILIYCSLLGLSPILKSLTQSTSIDSIWALSSWLMILNVFTFDYGAGPESKFPASLSTNAAVMASTVLASRLPSTTHVFSLSLFSIEVFGLFPMFRRHLRHNSWAGHLWLTTLLVLLASGGLNMTISGGGYVSGIVGAVFGSIICCLGMGLTSWWLIGLQRYKNEIHGPWDPARPVLRGVWD